MLEVSRYSVTSAGLAFTVRRREFLHEAPGNLASMQILTGRVGAVGSLREGKMRCERVDGDWQG